MLDQQTLAIDTQHGTQYASHGILFCVSFALRVLYTYITHSIRNPPPGPRSPVPMPMQKFDINYFNSFFSAARSSAWIYIKKETLVGAWVVLWIHA